MKKVAICGFASSSRHFAPFDNDEFEIWTMNHAPISWIPKWHVLFEFHTLEHLQRVTAHTVNPTQYIDWLKAQPGPEDPKHCPIYMQEHHESIPASVKLPREEMNAWFKARGGEPGFFAEDYWTSTISYMLGLAIMKGAPEIHLYGVDLLQDEEYFYQRAGAEYLIGFARGLGIKVYIPRQSALCQANYVYGVSEPATDEAKLTPLVDYIDDKAKLSDSMVAKHRQDANTYNGAQQMADLVLGWITEGKDVAALIKEKRDDLAQKFKQSHEAVITMAGQAEAFRTTCVWTRHFARGGALKS